MADRTCFILAAVPVRHHHQRAMLAGLARAAAGERGWHLLHHAELAADPALIADALAWKPDAVVCSGSRQLATACRRAGIPLVWLGDDAPALTVQVALDERATGRVAARHLADRGYRRLALLAPPGREQLARQDGLVAAARQLRLPLTVLSTPWPGQGRGWLASIDRLAELLAGQSTPTGVFCLNDALAWSAIAACRRRGIAVPGELGILGADDDPLAVLAGPIPLSSVALPHGEIGSRAAGLLATMLAGHSVATRTLVSASEVVERASTSLQRLPDPAVAAGLAYIAGHAGESIGVSDIAAAAGLARRTCERRFREQLGSSVLDELRRERMVHAKRLLQEGRPVGEAAAAIGMSVSAFRSAFVCLLGVTPGSWIARSEIDA